MRTSRAIASLIRSLMLGTAGLTGAAVLATTLVACKDESQPEYWVDKLSEPSWRSRAVVRLQQFFEDAVTKTNKNMQSKEVQELVDKTVEPLTKTYIEAYADMDTKTRVALIKLIADFRDKRSEPALKKAFDEFAKQPKTGKDDADIKWAARANEDLKLPGLADPMLQAFLKMRTSTMLGGVVYKDLNEAMIAARDKSWVGPLTTKLEAPINPPTAKDKEVADDFKDQLFWQTTAAEVLGRIGDPAAVPALMKVMLDPAKADVQRTAILALVKLGKPAADAAIKLLKGEDQASVDFYKKRVKDLGGEEPKGNPTVQTAALLLGTIGRQDSLPAMLEIVKNEKDDVTRAIVARELAKIPKTPDSIAAFKGVFESLSLETELPPQGKALEHLTEAAGQFHDPTLVEWLLERAEAVRGDADDRKALQVGIALTVMKIAKPNQMPAAKAAIDKYGTDVEKGLFANVDKVVKACGERADCYVAEIQKPENQDRTTQFAGIKAGYMISILGNEGTRDQLVAALDKINNASVRFVAAQAIDHLTPKGSKEVAAKLNDIVQKNSKSADRDKAAGDTPLKEVMYRLDTRG
jgi:HEAT repeat protein